MRLAAEYFGFAAPDDAQMMGWARACFREFFINLRNAPDMRAPAVTAGAEMLGRLDALLAERRAGGEDGKDDVMGRLLRLRAAGGADGVDDEVVRRTLPYSIFLVGFAFLLSFVLGTVIGMVAAWRRGRVVDNVVAPAFLALGALPAFFSALLGL